jgi:hypothetical protein
VLRRFAPASLAINFLLFSDDSMVEEQITSFPFQIVVKSRRNGFRCVFGVCLACVWLVWRVYCAFGLRLACVLCASGVSHSKMLEFFLS